MKRNFLTIGTRGSKLALIQSQQVKTRLETIYPQLKIDLKIIQTQGDKILDTALAKIGDKGLFVKEIESQLLADTIDLAVHSLKDMPIKQPEGLTIAAMTEREHPADVLVSKKGLSLAELPRAAKILTGSLRRRSQLLRRRSDLNIADLRGNIQTRLRKLDESDAQATVMAAAGLQRAGLEHRVTEYLAPTDFLPAPGQGALAIETRSDNLELIEIVGALNDKQSHSTCTAERALLAHLEGGCQTPIGAYAWIETDQLHLKAMIADLEGNQFICDHNSGSITEPNALGIQLAENLLNQGGRQILKEIKQTL